MFVEIQAGNLTPRLQLLCGLLVTVVKIADILWSFSLHSPHSVSEDLRFSALRTTALEARIKRFLSL